MVTDLQQSEMDYVNKVMVTGEISSPVRGVALHFGSSADRQSGFRPVVILVERRISDTSFVEKGVTLAYSSGTQETANSLGRKMLDCHFSYSYLTRVTCSPRQQLNFLSQTLAIAAD